METLKFLIATRLKQAKRSESTSGFTLIEILVALIIAFFVITPLLGLAVSLLNTDRQEQAKATSEQELQAAADFIARDLQQAVFIYSPEALVKIHSTNAAQSGIKDQIPPAGLTSSSCTTANCVPILVFWKRRPVRQAVPIDATNCKTATDTVRITKCNDTFVYSLVAYYLISSTNANAADVFWSNAARIGRFEITDGVKDINGTTLSQTSSRKFTSNGFKLFNLKLSAPTLADKMNSWTKDTVAYSANDMQILVDYIDQTPASKVSLVACPTGWSQSQIPTTTSSGFYTCVNQSANIARVFIRGNALARIRPGNTPPEYIESQSSYFPSVSAEVKAVGKLVQ